MYQFQCKKQFKTDYNTNFKLLLAIYNVGFVHIILKLIKLYKTVGHCVVKYVLLIKCW